jgi:hypothetical protein
MAHAQKQTNFSDVISSINILLLDGKHADASSFALRQLKRSCEQVRSVDAASGWSLLSSYYSVVGDVEEAERCFQASSKLAWIPVAAENHLTNLVNLGYFSKAQEFFCEYGSPKTGQFTGMARNGLAIGALRTFNDYFLAFQSSQAEPAILPNVQSEVVPVALAILDRFGITDSAIGRHLDAAGTVLRRMRLFVDDMPKIQAIDEPGMFSGVTFVFYVKRSQDEVFELNMMLAQEEADIEIAKHLALDVVFMAI